MLGEESGDRGPRRVPHYAARTITHSAPEFANHEQDVIRQSFAAGNHTWMKEALPVELAPDAVHLLRRQRMERNRLSEPLPQTWTKMTQLWGGGYYQEFEYIPDAYDRHQEHERKSRALDQSKRDIIANHDWRYTSQEKRLKHEPMVADAASKEAYPYLGGDFDQEIPSRHAKHLPPRWLAAAHTGRHWCHEKPGEEKPQELIAFVAGRGHGLDDNSRMSRMTLPQIVQRLQARLDADWEDTTVVVSATNQDLVQVAFHMATVDSERGVLAYMNVLSKDADFLVILGLRKVSQLWGMKRTFTSEQSGGGSRSIDDDMGEGSPEHTWAFFLLMPKWVRMRPTDAYYTVHPRAQGSAFRMSAAGSSVLLSLGSTLVAEDQRSSQKSHEESQGAAKAERSLPSAKQKPVDLNLIERAVSELWSS